MSNTPDYTIRILPTSNTLGYRFSGTDRNGPIDESVLNPTLTFNVGDRIEILFISDEVGSIPNQSDPLCDHALVLRKPNLTIAGEVAGGCPENTTVSCCSWFVNAIFAKEIGDAGTWTYESNSSQPNDIGGNIIFLPWKRAKTSFFALHSDWIGVNSSSNPDYCEHRPGRICNDITDINSSWIITEPRFWPFYSYNSTSAGDVEREGAVILTSMDSIFLPDGMSMHIFDGNDSANEEIFRAVGPILIWDGHTGVVNQLFVPEDIHARLSLQDSSLGGKWGDYVPVDRIFLNHPDSPNNGLPADCFYRIPINENDFQDELHDFLVYISIQAKKREFIDGEPVDYGSHTLELRSTLSSTPTTTTFPPTCGWFDENDSVGSITMDVAWEGDSTSGDVNVDEKQRPTCYNVKCDLLPLEDVQAYREAPLRAAPVTLTVTFSQPVPNPILFMNYLGGATPTTIQFSEDFEILCTEFNDDDLQSGSCPSLTPITRSILDDRTVTGRYGFGIIGFPGLHNSITFTYFDSENSTTSGQYRWGFCTDLPAAQTTTTTTSTTTTTTEAPAASPCFVSIGSLLIGAVIQSPPEHWTNVNVNDVQDPDFCSLIAGIGCNQPRQESNWKFTSPTLVTFNGNHVEDLGSKILSSCDYVFVANGNSFHVFDNNNVEVVRFTGPCLIINHYTRVWYSDERILDDSNPSLGGEDVQGNLSSRPSSLGGNWGDYITNDRVFFEDELPTAQGELFWNLPLEFPNGNMSEMHSNASPTEVYKFEIRTPTTCGDPITTTTLPPAYCIEETEYDADKHIIVSGPSSECLIECATTPAPTTPEPSTTTTTTADPVDDKVTCSDINPACLISENSTPVFGDSDIELAALPNGQTQLKIRSLSTDFQVAIGSFDPGSGDSNNDEYQSKFDNSCIPGFPESVSDTVGYLGMKFYLASGKFLGSQGHNILRHNHFLTGELKSFITGSTSFQYFTIEHTLEFKFSDFISNGWDGESTLTIELIGQMFDCEPGNGTTYNACASKTVNFTPAPVGCSNYIVNFQGDKVEDSSINTHWIHPEEADNNGTIRFSNNNGVKYLEMLDGGSVQIKSLDRIASAEEDFTIEFSFKLTSLATGAVLFSNNISGSFSDSGYFQIDVYTDNDGNKKVRIGIQNPEYILTGFTNPPFVSIVNSTVINLDQWYLLSFSRKNGVLHFYVKEDTTDSPPWFIAEEGEFNVYYESDEASKIFPCPIGRTENKLTLGFNNFYIGSKDSSQSFRGLMKNLLITNHGLGKISTFDAPISELEPCEIQEPQPELNCFSPFLQIGGDHILDGDLSIISNSTNTVINTLDSPFAFNVAVVDDVAIDGLAIGPGYKLDVYNTNSDASSDTDKVFSLTGPLLLLGSYLGQNYFDHVDDCDSTFLTPTQREACKAYNEDPLTGYAEIIKTFNTNIKPEYPWNSVFPTWSRKFLGDPSILAILETHLRALQDTGSSPRLPSLLNGKHGVLRKHIGSDCIEHTFPTTSTTAEPTTSTTTTTTPFPIDIDDYGTNASSIVFEQPIEIEIQKAMGVYGEQTFHNIIDQDEALYTGLGSQSGIWYKWDIVEKSLNLLHGKASGVAGIGSSSNPYLLPENDGSAWVDLIETEHRHSNGFFSYFYTGRQLPTIASIWFNSDEMFPEPSFNTYDIRIGVENTSRTERTEHQLMFDQRPLSDFKIVSPTKSIRYDPNPNIVINTTWPRLELLTSHRITGATGRPIVEYYNLGRWEGSAEVSNSTQANPIAFEVVGDGNISLSPVDFGEAFTQNPNGLDFTIISNDGQVRNQPAATSLAFSQYGFQTKASHYLSVFDGDRIIIGTLLSAEGQMLPIWYLTFNSDHAIPLGLYDTFHNRAVANDTNNIVDRNYIQGTHARGKGNEPVVWEIVTLAGAEHNQLFILATDSNGEAFLITRPQNDWAVLTTPDTDDVPNSLTVGVRCTITRTGTVIENVLTFDIRRNRDFALPNLYLDNSNEKLKLIHKDTPDDESYLSFDDPQNPARNDNNEPAWKNPRYSSTQNLALVDAWSEHGWDDTVTQEWRRGNFNRLKNANVPEDIVTIHEIKIGNGDFIPFYMSSPSNTMPLSIDIDNALEPISIGPVRLTDVTYGPLRQFPEQTPSFAETINTVVKLISNTDDNHILFPSCTNLQFRRYDCQGVPEIIRDRLLAGTAGTVPDTVLAWHFMGRTRARLATEEVGPLGSGNIITSDIYNIPSPHASGCPTEDPGFTNLYISFD